MWILTVDISVFLFLLICLDSFSLLLAEYTFSPSQFQVMDPFTVFFF